jgi:hypothetical protein
MLLCQGWAWFCPFARRSSLKGEQRFAFLSLTHARNPNMFEFVRGNKKIAQIILGLIGLTFVFFGIDGYMRGGSAAEVAKVGDIKITTDDFQRELRDRQERYRAQMGQMSIPR